MIYFYKKLIFKELTNDSLESLVKFILHSNMSHILDKYQGQTDFYLACCYLSKEPTYMRYCPRPDDPEILLAYIISEVKVSRVSSDLILIYFKSKNIVDIIKILTNGIMGKFIGTPIIKDFINSCYM